MKKWIVFSVSLLLAGTAQAQTWVGTYTTMGSKGPLTLTLRDIPDGIAGSLSGGGATFTLEGDSEDDGSISGLTIDTNDQPTSEFKLRRGAGGIEMEIGEDGQAKTRLLFKPGGAMPAPSAVKPPVGVGKPAPAPKTAVVPRPRTGKPTKAARVPTGGPAAGNGGWANYTHPIGLKFRHPSTWKVTEDAGILYVMPPNYKKDQFGATEGYLVAGQPAPGITSASDPQVVVHLDQELRQMAPFLAQTGQVTSVKAANTPGILAIWEGTNPRGQLIQARVYATIFKDHAVAVIALGDKTQIAAREGIVKTMFASLGAGAGKRDARLVGNWKFWSYKASANGQFGTEKTRYFVFRPDGSCTWSGKSESSGNVRGTDSLGNEVFNGGMVGGSTSGDNGKWSADNGQLYVLWNDGDSSQWSYRLGPGRLFLKGKGAEDEWVQAR